MRYDNADQSIEYTRELFKPEGAKEVRMAAEAFIEMKERIKRQINQRTEMLAGVSHDLKTPLTRMKLQLAMMKPSKTIAELQSDLIDMEKMVHGYLNFVKGAGAYTTEMANITDVLRNITSGYRRHHQDIELKTQSGVIIPINISSFKRAINNIIDNGLKYGSKVAISVKKERKHVALYIDDDGPGIPPKKRESVFKPFYRLDRSRNLETGGIGLGLAITRDIITGYGGSIILGDSPLGGLRVIIKMPL